MSGPADQAVRTYEPLAEELMTGLNLLRSNKDLFDVTIIIGNKPFQAHKAVLASLSGYFQVMFTNRGFVDINQSEIEIKEEGLVPESFDHLLDFMYTGKVHMTNINMAIDLLQIAGFLQVKGAIELCVGYLKAVTLRDNIPFETAFDLSSIANRLDHPDLKNIVDRYVGQNMMKFLETVEFLEQMTAAYLEDLLKREDLNETISEEELLEVVAAWLQFDWSGRKVNAAALLQNIRLGVIPDHVTSEILGEEIGPIAKEVISKEDKKQSTHRGTVTMVSNGLNISFQVVRLDQERQGFRGAVKNDLSNRDEHIQKLLSKVMLNKSAIYPLSLRDTREMLHPRNRRRFPENAMEDDDDDDDEDANFGDATHKILTNLPKFLVKEIDSELHGWSLAWFSEAEECLERIKPLLSMSTMWYICRLSDGKIAGSGYDYDMQMGDFLDLGHQLLVRYPQEFCIAHTKQNPPGWQLASIEDVKNNLNRVKFLLTGKRARYVCLLEDGTLSGEEFSFGLQSHSPENIPALEYHVLVKSQNENY